MIIDLFIAYSYKTNSKEHSGLGVGNCIIGVTSLPKSYEDIERLQNVIIAKNEGFMSVAITNWIIMGDR